MPQKIQSQFCLTALLLLLITGCATHQTQVSDQQSALYSDAEHAVTKVSEAGLYRVSLYSSTFPLQLQQIHSWVLHIESMDGSPVEDADVFMFGGMPAHQHDYPTKPVIKQYLGNGNYKVEGIKFSMPGHWDMRFTIKQTNKRDRVVFDIHLN